MVGIQPGLPGRQWSPALRRAPGRLRGQTLLAGQRRHPAGFHAPGDRQDDRPVRRRQPVGREVQDPGWYRARGLRLPVRAPSRVLRRAAEGILGRGTKGASPMQELQGFVAALRVGGAMIYPLLLLAVVAVVVILEKAFVFATRTRLPGALLEVLETYGFAWDDLEQRLGRLDPRNYFGRFFRVIYDN